MLVIIKVFSKHHSKIINSQCKINLHGMQCDQVGPFCLKLVVPENILNINCKYKSQWVPQNTAYHTYTSTQGCTTSISLPSLFYSRVYFNSYVSSRLYRVYFTPKSISTHMTAQGCTGSISPPSLFQLICQHKAVSGLFHPRVYFTLKSISTHVSPQGCTGSISPHIYITNKHTCI